MTDPISIHGRPVQSDATRTGGVKSERRAGLNATSQPLAAPEESTSNSDRVDLSQLATANSQTEAPFDAAKVERIRQAIQQGQYAIDPKRIAENFMAIERMLKD